MVTWLLVKSPTLHVVRCASPCPDGNRGAALRSGYRAVPGPSRSRPKGLPRAMVKPIALGIAAIWLRYRCRCRYRDIDVDVDIDVDIDIILYMYIHVNILKMTICSGFTHWKWWFSIAMLNYQRVRIYCQNNSALHLWSKSITGILTFGFWHMSCLSICFHIIWDCTSIKPHSTL